MRGNYKMRIINGIEMNKKSAMTNAAYRIGIARTAFPHIGSFLNALTIKGNIEKTQRGLA